MCLKMKTAFLKKIFLLLLVSILFFTPVFAASPPAQVHLQVQFDTTTRADGAIPFSRNRPLTYEDFRGVIPGNVPEGNVAQTVAVIGYQMKSRTVRGRTEAVITLSLTMASNTAWMKPAGRTPEVLHHEQVHFDIAAIYACRLKQELESTFFFPESFKEQLRNVYQSVNEATAAEQARYDLETLHGIDAKAQARWEVAVAERLRQISCF